jgi:putative hydrolase of the HAD superfamily
MRAVIRAVFWDFGGVILSSPFDAFNRYEAERGLPKDFIRSVNATNPHTNAWARLERSDIDPATFDEAFAAESASLGHRVPGADVLGLLAGDVRPTMVDALRRLRQEGFVQACLTNNVLEEPAGAAPAAGRRAARARLVAEVMAIFDHVVESSKVGCRKPEPRFYELACERSGVDPTEVVFLDDLGINLKPAAAMGMRTIKVTDPAVALVELSMVVGLELTDR